MSVLDLVLIVILVGYAILGMFSGVIRRVIGFLALFLAFAAATYVAPGTGNFLQQMQKSLDPADARIYAFFGTVIVVIVLIEGLAAAYHPLLQFSFVILDRLTGLALGVITALVAWVLVVYLLNAAGNPINNNPSVVQTQIRNSVNGSVLHGPVLGSGGIVEKLFSPVIPDEPERYFSASRST
jgi:uncharacterized membrane protein required for colicin V production